MNRWQVKFFGIAQLGLCFMLLAGCTLEGDEKSPTVSLQSPEANTTGVSLDSVIALTFSEAILVDNLTTDSLVATMNGDPLAGDLAYDANNNQLVFTPQQALPLFQTITVNYGPGITDRANNEIDSGSWQFTTVDGVWQAEADLSLPGSDGNSATVMMDNSGYGIATWVQSDGFFNAVHAAHYVPETGWNSPGIVDIFSSDNAIFKVANMNPSTGTALVTWIESNGFADQLWGTLYTTSQGWAVPEVINTGSANDVSSSASFYIADDNSVDVAWTENDGGITTVWTNHFDPVLGWQSPIQIQTNTSQNALSPRLHGNGSGELVVTWQQETAVNQYSLIVANYDAVNGWTDEILETLNTPIIPGSVQMNGSGQAMAVWAPSSGADVNLRYTIYEPGTGWQSPSTAVVTGGEIIAVSKLYFEDDGSAHLLYTQGTSMNGFSIFTQEFDGSTWGNLTTLADDPNNDNLTLSVSRNSLGVIAASWMELVGFIGDPPTESAIQFNRYNPGTGWGISESLHFTANQLAVSPSIGIADSGETLVVWRQSDPSVPSITIKQRVLATP